MADSTSLRHHTGLLVERFQAQSLLRIHRHRRPLLFEHLEQVVVHVVVGSFGQYEVWEGEREEIEERDRIS